VSTNLGRILRVRTGWRAVPGKNLVVFDDALVEIRASAFDGLIVNAYIPAGGALPQILQSLPRQYGEARDKGLDKRTWTPETLVNLHPANWMIPNSTVKSATMTARWMGIFRRLTLQTEEGTRIVEWEARPNPNYKIVPILKQAFGERFSVSGRYMRLDQRIEEKSKAIGKDLATSPKKWRRFISRIIVFVNRNSS
jgi:hypothetical protein